MNQPFDREYDELERWLHGQVSDTEAADVARRIAREPRVARRVAELATLEMRLRAMFEDAPGARVAEPLRPRPTRARGRAFALAACAAIVLLLVAMWTGRRARAPLATARRPAPTRVAPVPPPFAPQPGAPTIAGARERDLDGVIGQIDGIVVAAMPGNLLQPGRGPVAPGTRGMTTIGAGSSVRLEDAAGVRIDLRGDSAVHGLAMQPAGEGREAPGYYLSRGGMIVPLPARRRGVALVTPQGTVRAQPGTRVALTATGLSSRVEVTMGAVTLADRGPDGASIDVKAGARALIGVGPPMMSDQRHGLAVFLTANLSPERRDPAVAQADQLIEERLWAHGFDVRRSLATESVDADLAAATLVVISASVRVNDVDMNALRALPVPIVAWETGAYPALGLTARSRDGALGARSATSLLVAAANHPLAAGLAGAVRVAKGGFLGWGDPPPQAVRVLVWPDRPDRAALFGIERGAALGGDGTPAPARRVGLFLRGDAAAHLTAEGWRLIDATVAWAIERS